MFQCKCPDTSPKEIIRQIIINIKFNIPFASMNVESKQTVIVYLCSMHLMIEKTHKKNFEKERFMTLGDPFSGDNSNVHFLTFV